MLDPCNVSQKKALLVGDLMLDHYTFGVVERISPEAPVLVLQAQREEKLPGGAGNAMVNLTTLGMQVAALGRVGKDEAGKELINLLEEEGIETEGIIIDKEYLTPRKNRLIAAQQQLMRVDYENTISLHKDIENTLIHNLSFFLENVDIVAISDYGKGFLTSCLIQAIIRAAKVRSIPVVVDPKGRNFSKYRGATLLKPNLSEAIFASGLSQNASLEEVAQTIMRQSQIENLLITRSEKGISLFSGNNRHDFPAVVREVKDVTGAGDTVLAVMTLCLAMGLSLKEGIELANVAAGHVVEHLGCARVTLEQIGLGDQYPCANS